MAGDYPNEHTFPVTVLEPDADRFNGDPASDVVNLANYQGVTFHVQEGAGGTGTAAITVEECTAADGTGATAIAFEYEIQTTHGTQGTRTAATASGVTPAAGANKLTSVHVNADSLSAGSNYVRLQFTEGVDSPVDAGCLAIMWGPRFSQATMIDPLS